MNRSCFLFLSFLGLHILTTGCANKNSPSTNSPTETVKTPSVSSTPLRIWFVEPNADLELVRRQWQSVSEQAIELETLNVTNFLAKPSCDCDIVIYPARLLGELVKRAWLSRSHAPASSTKNSRETAVVTLPPAWIAQCRYAGHTWARPLGCPIPLMLSDSKSGWDADKFPSAWQEVWRPASSNDQRQAIKPSEINRDALVDRFLTIACTLTRRNLKYGILFEMQTMRPRLEQPEFVQACEVLRELAQHSRDGIAASGDWSRAWAWLAEDRPGSISVGVAAIHDPAAQPVTTIRVSLCPPLLQSDPTAELPTTNGTWNPGLGLIASLSEGCRQSSRADLFVDWLASSTARGSFAKTILGIDADAPISGTDASEWQVSQLERRMAGRVGVAIELRLPGTELYRAALAEQLTRILMNQVDISTGLKQVASEWEKITEQHDRKLQRTQYEYSLGLM